MHRIGKYSQHRQIIWPVWLNGWVFVYELSGWGFESSCSHLNFRFCACFEQGVPWHSRNYRVWIHSETRRWHDKNIHLNCERCLFVTGILEAKFGPMSTKKLSKSSAKTELSVISSLSKINLLEVNDINFFFPNNFFNYIPNAFQIIFIFRRLIFIAQFLGKVFNFFKQVFIILLSLFRTVRPFFMDS